METWTHAVSNAPYGLSFNWSWSITSYAQSAFTNGTTDYAVTDYPYGVDGSGSPAPGFAYDAIPIVGAGVSFVYNIPGLASNLRLSSLTACGVLSGAITNWDAPNIASDNPGVPLPNLPVVPVTDSSPGGANYALEQWCIGEQPALWSAFANFELNQSGGPSGGVPISATTASADWPPISGGIDVHSATSSANAALSDVSSTPGSIAAVLGSYGANTTYHVASVRNASGYYTLPTPFDVTSALASATELPDGTVGLDFNATGPHVYNPSTVSDFLTPTSGWSPDKGATVSGFLNYALTIGQQHAPQFGYASLGSSLEQAGLQRAARDLPGAVAPTADEQSALACGDLTSAEAQTGQLAPPCWTPNPGTLYAWGYNGSGGLGDGTTGDHSSPESIFLPTGVTPTTVSTGGNGGMVIGSDGNLYAWGNNDYSQLPGGTPHATSLAPGVKPTAISAGALYDLAIGSDGKLYAWGFNRQGQLGDGTSNAYQDTPEVVSLAPGVLPTAISAGYDYSLAIGSDGNLYGWGWNFEGELGDGTTVSRNTPEVITLASGVTPVSVSAGNGGGIAIGSDGKLYAWGGSRVIPQVLQLAPGVTPTAISAGTDHSLAIGSDGNLYAWGSNTSGQLGDGTTISRPSPEAITLASGVTPSEVAAGGSHNLAIGSDGQLYAWGSDSSGQLGDGSTTDHHRPEVISIGSGVAPVAIAADGSSSFAIGSGQSAGPGANLPETPVTLALPLAAALILAAVWWTRRHAHRRQSDQWLRAGSGNR